jgi:hypothetical protein
VLEQPTRPADDLHVDLAHGVYGYYLTLDGAALPITFQNRGEALRVAEVLVSTLGPPHREYKRQLRQAAAG